MTDILGGTAAELAAERFEDDPEVRLLVADSHASEGRWERVDEALVGVEPRAFAAPDARHYHHLRALAALFTLRLDEAARHAKAGRAFEGQCELASIEVLAGKKASKGDSGAKALEELVDRIRKAGKHLARGDARAAVRTLDVVRRGAPVARAPRRGLPRRRSSGGRGARAQAHRAREPARRAGRDAERDASSGSHARRLGQAGVAARAGAWLDALRA